MKIKHPTFWVQFSLSQWVFWPLWYEQSGHPKLGNGRLRSLWVGPVSFNYWRPNE